VLAGKKKIYHRKMTMCLLSSGTEEDGYRYLSAYLKRVVEVNRGATAFVESSPRFQRAYISLRQCRITASYCRHLLFLDYAHFKGTLYVGVVSASTIDANDHIVLISLEIVPDENVCA